MLLTLHFLASANAESPPEPLPPAWTVTVDPLTAALGFAHVQVERRISAKFSLYAGPSLRLYDSAFGEPSGPFVGVGAEVGLRWFWHGYAPEGAWVMARGVLARVSTDTPSPMANIGGYTSALVGYTWIADFGLVLAGGLGVSWFDYGVGEHGIHGVLPAAHSNIGWAF